MLFERYKLIRGNGFFLLTPSVWPIFSALVSFLLLANFTLYFNYYESTFSFFFLGFVYFSFAFLFWFRDLIRELTLLKKTSRLLESNLRDGFWLFIVSEAMLFFSFFWAFFHASLEVGHELGITWPPYEGLPISSLSIPALNTVILLVSGASLAWVQYCVLADDEGGVISGFLSLFLYAFLFLLCQFVEYFSAGHQVNDSVFGSTMYVLTLFHGFHVLIGSIFLFTCFVRFLLGHIDSSTYISLTLAGWYWHFVDFIWVLVFIFIYSWGTYIFDGQTEVIIAKFFN